MDNSTTSAPSETNASQATTQDAPFLMSNAVCLQPRSFDDEVLDALIAETGYARLPPLNQSHWGACDVVGLVIAALCCWMGVAFLFQAGAAAWRLARWLRARWKRGSTAASQSEVPSSDVPEYLVPTLLFDDPVAFATRFIDALRWNHVVRIDPRGISEQDIRAFCLALLSLVGRDTQGAELRVVRSDSPG